MMSFSEWITRWNVPAQCIEELRAVLAGPVQVLKVEEGISESASQQRIRLRGSKLGLRLWRNNRGALMDERGRLVRYGLANESKAMDTMIKSHDLIGIKPHIVQPHEVGRTLGVFVSIEAKPQGWSYKGSDREVAQLRWANLISTYGGVAGFATCEADVDNILARN